MRVSADRLISALPAAGGVLVVAVFYGVEAHLHKAPTVFTDELEWTQLSRSIAATGHAARRGQAFGFESLYSYVIAPAWWIHSTASAYAAIKYINALVMCLTAVPAYLLSRMLVARRAAVVVGILSIAIPAMSYATSIVPESLAYFWFVLAAWLGVRALANPSTAAAALAIGAAIVGPLIREEFVVLPASLILAAAAIWVIRRGRSIRPQSVVLAVVGVVVVGFLFNIVVIHHFQSRGLGEYLNGHTLREAGLAAGALTIGLGVLPAIGGLLSLWLPERQQEPAYRAFAVYVAISIVALTLYTAGKATVLLETHVVVPPVIEERNLFYLSPLLFLGTALAIGARKLFWPLAVAATALVLVVVWARAFQVGGGYYEAPGLSVLVLVNRDFIWTVQDVHRLLVGAVIVSLALLTVRRRRLVPAIATLLAFGWLLTGEIYATVGNDTTADRNAAKSPSPRNWIDQDTGGKGTAFLVQGVGSDATVPWLLEFWNRSLNRMASLDGSAPGPGPTFVPGLLSAEGALSEWTGDAYTLTSGGLTLDAPVVDQRNGFTLYRTPKSWRLQSQELNFYTDSWAHNPIEYAYFGRGGPGVVVVELSRTAFNSPGRGRVTIRVGEVAINQGGGLAFGQVLSVRRGVLPNGTERTFRVPVARTPVMLSVTVTPTVHQPGDLRPLAAQPSFSFESGKGSAHRHRIGYH